MINLDKADRYFGEVYSLLKKTGTTAQIIMKGGKSVDEVKNSMESTFTISFTCQL